MPVKKYLEIDSTYRNRNLYPNPGSFSVNIAQGITKSQVNAVDPVTNAFSDIVMKNNYLNNIQLTFTIATGANPPLPIIASSSKTTLIMTTPSNTFLTDFPKNALSGLVLINNQNIPNFTLRRIISSSYLTNVNNLIYLQVEIDNPIPDNLVSASNTFTIFSPTTIQTVGTYFYLPMSKAISNFYKNYILYNKTEGNCAVIDSYDKTTHLAYISQDLTNYNWDLSDVFEVKKEAPLFSGILGTGLSNFQNSVDIGRKTGLYCINSFLQCSSNNTSYSYSVFKITHIIGTYVDENGSLLYTTNIDLMTAYTDYVITDGYIDVTSLPFFEFLQYSYDNAVNFSYSGSMVSITQSSAYEVSLHSLCLPNVVLDNGGFIWQYPFVYVELENVSSSSNSLNLIYSNNPNSNKAVFKVPIINFPSDFQNLPFLSFTGNEMTQTITIKPNSDMRISIKLPNGTVFSPYIWNYNIGEFTFDTIDGQASDSSNQLSVLFSFEKM